MKNTIFEELIKYCDQYYQENKHQGYKCINHCSHDNANCSGFCSSCMEELTWNKANGRTNYNCENLTAYYVCKFLNRFSSEIYHAINSSFIAEKLINFEKFNILSLGCGPCSDVIAFDTFNITNMSKPVDIYYRGIDIAKSWQYIHQKLKKLAEENNYTEPLFSYSDVFKKIKDGPIKDVNILVVQNLISTFKRTGSDEKLSDFINNLTENVINYMPNNSVIIINDINSINLLRDKWLSVVKSKLESSPRRGRYHILYFDKNYGNTSWLQHTNDKIIFDYPVEFNNCDYSDWDHCSGVQLLITLEDS
jgi:hypothetical protein